MMQARIFADTRNMSRENWLELRRQGIGGSDAAAILGMSRYATPYTVYADKQGLLPEREDTEAMLQGRMFEEKVAERFSTETGIKVRRVNRILQHAELPFMIANIDRECVGLSGIRAGLECKTSRDIYMRRFKNGEFPEEYYCQCMHYLTVTGWDRWYLAVLIYGTEFKVFQIDRDEDEINALIAAESEFWQNLQDGNVPEPDGLAPTSAAIDAMYAESECDAQPLELSNPNNVVNYLALQEQIDALTCQREKCKELIQLEMAGREKATSGSYSVSWKQVKRRTFDSKAFIAANPDASVDEYYKVSASRRFEIREAK